MLMKTVILVSTITTNHYKSSEVTWSVLSIPSLLGHLPSQEPAKRRCFESKHWQCICPKGSRTLLSSHNNAGHCSWIKMLLSYNNNQQMQQPCIHTHTSEATALIDLQRFSTAGKILPCLGFAWFGVWLVACCCLQPQNLLLPMHWSFDA